MEACSRYQVLHNEDDSPQTSDASQPTVPSESPQTSTETDIAPPPYSSVTMGATASATETDLPSDLMPVPPPYSVATSLPTYDEAEKAKAAAMAAGAAEPGQREEDFPPRDDFNDADQLRVGNDGIFMLAFFRLLLFFRGFINYLKIRNMSENMAATHRTRLFFLY
ncbi:hypothetical protein chiPu_0012934 [Chiloscyllium punctatum]|uniref:Nedd4 family interacting protein 2 n=1 Tax=Chiloscyllium punctatum TaxID=137246 RepID=A0A401SVQ8_CHIPU|nr:hypothetical protein [Chiloscyllium punctatum]